MLLLSFLMLLPGFTDLYLGAMDAIWAMTPNAPIFVVEGAGQGAYAGLNWVSGGWVMRTWTHPWDTFCICIGRFESTTMHMADWTHHPHHAVL